MRHHWYYRSGRTVIIVFTVLHSADFLCVTLSATLSVEKSFRHTVLVHTVLPLSPAKSLRKL
jgi:hypothetical protein